MWPSELKLPDLPRELERLLAQIPQGRVTTYGDLADALGTRSASRWVGEYLLHHPHDEFCACHRVVLATGELGRFIEAAPVKKRRLRDESVDTRGGRVDLDRLRFCDFKTTRPLAALVASQEALRERTRVTPFRRTPKLVGGIDVAYTSAGDAVGAYVLLDSQTGRVTWSSTMRGRVSLPYIPGLLSFRESPLMLALLDKVRREDKLASVVFVDGNGLLHPRRAGIATQVGVLGDVRTIGIGKKLLCGSVDLKDMRANEPRPVLHQDCLIGMAVKSNDASKPIFVSVGHDIDLADAVRLTYRLFHGHRLPEAIHQADFLTRQAARAETSG